MRTLSHVFFLDPSPVRRVPIQTGIQRKLNFVSARTIKGRSSWKAIGVDLTQGFIQAELPKDGKAIYISPPPRHVGEPECGISSLEASVRHAAFWQVSARHMSSKGCRFFLFFPM